MVVVIFLGSGRELGCFSRGERKRVASRSIGKRFSDGFAAEEDAPNGIKVLVQLMAGVLVLLSL